MADWEPGYAISELHSGRYFKTDAIKYDIKTVSLVAEPISTMGGVKVMPDLTIDEVDTAEAGLLLLPGGATWLDSIQAPVFKWVNRFLTSAIPVAAICGATLGLAANGFLDQCYHTSNDLEYLKAVCPDYRGEPYYRDQAAVSDGDLITASGIAPLDFARAILQKLEVFLPETLEAWYQLNHTHDTSHYYDLMESLPRDA